MNTAMKSKIKTLNIYALQPYENKNIRLSICALQLYKNRNMDLKETMPNQ